MAKIVVTENQDLFDFSIQNFGQIDNIFSILALNPGLDINSNLAAGTELEVNVEGEGDLNAKEFYERSSLKPVNSDEIDIFTNEGNYNNDYNNDYS